MKVSELSGAKLDCWVAKANGYELHYRDSKNMLINGISITSPEYRAGWHVYDKGEAIAVIPDPDSGKYNFVVIYSPSTDWAQGGPIIHHENIMLVPPSDDFEDKSWGASNNNESIKITGETPLIAAMRCKVASAYGEEVDDEKEAP